VTLTPARLPAAAGPAITPCPEIGFVNLLGATGAPLAAADRAAIGDPFRGRVHNTDRITSCDVLFLYCGFEPARTVAGQEEPLRGIFDKSRAAIAVVASELPAAMKGRNPRFKATIDARGHNAVNMVITLDRKGDKFGRFFQALFAQMSAGVPMLTAWVKLAPQVTTPAHEDLPETFFVPEAGQITFAEARRTAAVAGAGSVPAPG